MTKKQRKRLQFNSLDEFVLHITANLEPAVKEQLRTTNLPPLALHHGFGAYIRNEYLYGGGCDSSLPGMKLLMHPDDLSALLVRRVMELIRDWKQTEH